jgi:hypothetical protein
MEGKQLQKSKQNIKPVMYIEHGQKLFITWKLNCIKFSYTLIYVIILSMLVA